jgi:hypothetical protein
MLDQRAGTWDRPRPDPLAAIAVALLTVLGIALALGGILAIYDWQTPAAERPLFFTGLAVFGSAVAILVLGAAVRWARTGHPR